MARTAWGAMQVHRYNPATLAGMLALPGIDPDFTNPDTQAAILRLADQLAATWGDDNAAGDAARAAGFHPIMAYTERWEVDPAAIHDSPVNTAVVLMRQRWEIVRLMAEGWPTNVAQSVNPDAWCERTMQRFRNQHMTTEPSRYEAFQYAQDDRWLLICDEAEDDPVGAALQHGLVRHQDLPAGHPAREAVAEQSRLRRLASARERRAQRATEAGVATGQLAFAM